jgi:hypothetical protein
MHIGHNDTKSKTEAMFFPNSLKEAKALRTAGNLPPSVALPNNWHIQFTHSFQYLGSTITTELNKDAEIQTRISKAKSILGLMTNFLNNKDVDIGIKQSMYVSFALKAAANEE